MTRSVDIPLSRRDAVEMCRAARVGIYDSEQLDQNLTRIYCKTETGADELRRQLSTPTQPSTYQRDRSGSSRTGLSASTGRGITSRAKPRQRLCETSGAAPQSLLQP